MARKHSKDGAFKRFCNSYIPNKKDSFGQILTKLLFIVCLVAFVVSAAVLINYYLEAKAAEDLAEQSRDIWNDFEVNTSSQIDQPDDDVIVQEKPVDNRSPIQKLLDENNDFIGWIKVNNTKVNYPVYQTADNDYYLTHNQQKKRSAYGAIYIDCDNTVTSEKIDKNLVIYGHEMKNGSMFGSLKKLRSLDFYKQNPTVNFSTIHGNGGIYKIYSIFVLNADKNDDGGSIYNIYRKEFHNDYDFELWRDEALKRSVLKTNVDVNMNDDIITLVTCCDDFENARLVIMARKTRDGESESVDTSSATLNENPRYPLRWYEDRGIEPNFE